MIDPLVIVRRLFRFAVRSVLVPVLVAAAALGVTGGGHGTASVTPGASAIATELSAHHDLPKNTRLSVGDPAKPTMVTYDDRGRLVITPPRGESFGAIVWRGLGDLREIAGNAGVDVARVSAVTPTSSQSAPK